MSGKSNLTAGVDRKLGGLDLSQSMNPGTLFFKEWAFRIQIVA